jgi:hypothetical protein
VNSGAAPSGCSCRASASSAPWEAPTEATRIAEEPPSQLAPAGQLVEAFGHAVRALKARGDVHVRDVLGDELVEVDVQADRDREPRDDHDRAEAALDRRAAAGAARAVHQRTTAQRKREQDDCRPGRVGDREDHRAAAGGTDRDHRREHRAGAGRVDKAERSPDDEP